MRNSRPLLHIPQIDESQSSGRTPVRSVLQSIVYGVYQLILVLSLIYGTAAAQTPLNPNGFDAAKTVQAMLHPKSDLILLVAHRGDHAMLDYPTNVPENSLESIRRAAAAGLEMVEVDIRTTKDGVPILSHDETWGREINYCAPAHAAPFDPLIPIKKAASPSVIASNEACNPKVNSLSLAAIRTSGVVLRDSVNYVDSSEQPSTLQQVLDYLKANQIAMVLALDIKTSADALACWSVIEANTDYLGRPSALTTVFRIQAASYPAPADFKQAFGQNYSAVNYWPTYGTGILTAPPSGFGSEQAAIQSLQQFQQDSSISLIAAEVQIKEFGGILTQMIDNARQNVVTGAPTSVTEFNPISEWYDPDDPYPAYFYGTSGTYRGLSDTDPAKGTPLGGHCCISLDYYYYHGTNGQPSDTADRRTDINFILDNRPNIITTDDAVHLAQTLASQGKRNLKYLEAPKCGGSSDYPGCQADGLTSYTYCVPGDQGRSCSFTGDRNVAYGANGKYNYKTVTNSTSCDIGTLGPNDPIYGVHKACYYSAPISYDNGIYCADENQYCYFNGTGIASIAANQTFYEKYFPVYNGFQCDAASFGWFSDPIPGHSKSCFYQLAQPWVVPRTGPTGYTYCSPENGDCQFLGRARVKYGASGSFKPMVFDGGTPCTNDVFGDPIPGQTKDCWYEVITASSGATGTNVSGPGSPGGNGGPGNPGGNGGPGSGMQPGSATTCDLYAAGGTPCVAAHSTIRTLFGGYTGRLYQVQRASDGHTLDINVASGTSYADSGSQESFCAGTTCTITIIYDQTTRHNDLTIAGPGGAAQHNDVGAVANALPIHIAGRTAYGVKVTPGVGYRNNATNGVARGNQPEGMYMVTSSKFVNKDCCFDYGNAETSSNDTGNGHMDAVNFQTECYFPPCNGPGPWVSADLENGLFQGNGSNTGNQSVNYPFVTAMLKNDGNRTFALKSGNAQYGGLTTQYSGSLPTNQPNYLPMHLEGSIILGTGGDNSDWAVGYFFEGAMTAGYPSDATDDQIQASIAAAGYTDTPGGGVTGSTGGTGPQFSFPPVAIQQTPITMGSAPALASFNGSLYAAFRANDASHTLFVSSSHGANFPAATPQTAITIGSAPAMVAFNKQLFIAFQADDASHQLFITSSFNGTNFPHATPHSNLLLGSAPAMTVFNNKLWLAFQANDQNHHLFLSSSSDGQNWPNGTYVPNVQIGSAPALAVLNNKLYVAFKSDDANNTVWIASSPDGVNFTSQSLPNETMGGNSAPALVTYNNTLYYIYESDDGNNTMLVTTSTDGTNWSTPAIYTGTQVGDAGPGAAAFGNGVYVAFQADDSRNVLFLTNNTVASTGQNASGQALQASFATPAAQETNITGRAGPAMATFNGSLYAAVRANDSSDTLFIGSSIDGVNWPAAAPQTAITVGGSPAMATFNNQLFVAFVADDASQQLFVTSSPTGGSFPHATPHPNIILGSDPAMAVFNDRLYLAFRANDSTHNLFVTSSSDGINWPKANPALNVKMAFGQPAMAAFNGKLYIAFKADDSSNSTFITSSSDGVNFTSEDLLQPMVPNTAPSLVAYNNTLYYIYAAPYSGSVPPGNVQDQLAVMTSTDGTTWSPPAYYPSIQVGLFGPAAAAFSNGVYVGFTSADTRNMLFTTNNAGRN